MSRNSAESQRNPSSSEMDNFVLKTLIEVSSLGPRGSAWEFWLVRSILIAGAVALCIALRPFGLRGLPAAAAGSFVALVILYKQKNIRMKKCLLKSWIWRATRWPM